MNARIAVATKLGVREQARRPLLLILDDLHWADASSISLLFHLARRLAGSSILILGAYRPEEISLGREEKEHPLAGVLAEFKRLFGNTEVELRQDEVTGRSFVDALLDAESNAFDEKFRLRLAESTRGHPLFTVETLQNLREQGHVYRDRRGRWVESPTLSWEALPRRVEGVIEKRISRLAPALRRALLAASVEGEEFTPTQFYDLAADPYEMTNLVEQPERAPQVAVLRERIVKWQTQSVGRGGDVLG